MDLKRTIEEVLAEVDIAINNYQAAYNEISCTYIAYQTRKAQVEGKEARWQELTGDDEIGSIILEQLLDDQDKLVRAESEFVEAMVRFNQSITELKYYDGTLLRFEFCCADSPRGWNAQNQLNLSLREPSCPPPQNVFGSFQPMQNCPAGNLQPNTGRQPYKTIPVPAPSSQPYPPMQQRPQASAIPAMNPSVMNPAPRQPYLPTVNQKAPTPSYSPNAPMPTNGYRYVPVNPAASPTNRMADQRMGVPAPNVENRASVPNEAPLPPPIGSGYYR